MEITSGIGNGKTAAVDNNNRLKVRSESFPYQKVISFVDEQVYDVFGTALLANSVSTALHLTNTSTTKNLVILNINYQVIDAAGGTVFPNANNYFSLNYGQTYASGGSLITPVNLNIGSGKAAEATIYQGSPTLGGSDTEISRWYPEKEGERYIFDIHGALIVQSGQSIDVQMTTDHTSGFFYAEIEFLMELIDED